MKIERRPCVEARRDGGACHDGSAEGGPNKYSTEHGLGEVLGIGSVGIGN